MSSRLGSKQSEVCSTAIMTRNSMLMVSITLDIEKTLSVPPPPLLSVHPLRPLYDACRFLIRTHARRLPLIDKDTQTGGEVVISVLTQYRVLKFIAMNVSTEALG
jgi:CBS domain-containing protein